MASPTELDLFSRAVGFDLQARKEIYRRLVYGSAHVRRRAAGSNDIDSFLHDCFNNLVRTGHSWDTAKEDSLSEWVESVAAWTALVNARRLDRRARAASGEIRMCAEMEGEDATQGEVLPAYEPPFGGAGDSPSARILAFLDDAEKAVFHKRAMENATWVETAAAAGQPLKAVGPIFARATGRIARLFGAPAPMQYDLVRVFRRRFTDPQGRALSLRLDLAFYSPTPEMRTIGLETQDQARTIALWDVARNPAPPNDALRRHLDNCAYCSDLLDSLLLMQKALVAPPGVKFLLCPGAFTLANTPDLVREAFDQHLAECPICREERAATQMQPPGSSGRKTAWALAAILLLCLGSVAGYRYFAHNAKEAALSLTAGKLQDTVAIDRRYADLVQNVHMDDAGIMASVLPANRRAMRYAIDQYSLGNAAPALAVSAKLAANTNDPGAMLLYSACLRRENLIGDSYRQMLKAEAVAPRDSLRCWITLQFSLLVADRPVIEREAQHLAADPKYRDRANKILASVRARG